MIADTGSIGGSASHEFHVLANSGEDDIASATPAVTPPMSKWPRRCRPAAERPAPSRGMKSPPRRETIEELAAFLAIAHGAAKTRWWPRNRGRAGSAGAARRPPVEPDQSAEAAGDRLALRMASEEEVAPPVVPALAHWGRWAWSCHWLSIAAPPAWRTSAVAPTATGCFHLTGVNWGRDCPWAGSRTCARLRRATPAPTATARCRSSAASRWAIFPAGHEVQRGHVRQGAG